MYNELASSKSPGCFRDKLIACGMLEWMFTITNGNGCRNTCFTIHHTTNSNSEDIVILLANLIGGIQNGKYCS